MERPAACPGSSENVRCACESNMSPQKGPIPVLSIKIAISPIRIAKYDSSNELSPLYTQNRPLTATAPIRAYAPRAPQKAVAPTSFFKRSRGGKVKPATATKMVITATMAVHSPN